MILAAVFALFLSNALQAFQILLQIGAGTGLIFILRWFWWRVNAKAEITAMVVSFVIALVMELWVKDGLPGHYKLILGVLLTTISWIIVVFTTKPTDYNVLVEFVKCIRPYPTGWKKVIDQARKDGLLTSETMETGSMTKDLINMITGCILVYAMLFGTGFLLYGETLSFFIALIVSGLSAYILYVNWKGQSHRW
jgi:hypothetical protein